MPQTKAARTQFEHANPILNVADLARSVAYYVDVLGFANADWGGKDFTCVSRDGASIYLSEGDQGHPGTWVWVGVGDVEALHAEYEQSGARILQPPENFPWACEMKLATRMGTCFDLGRIPRTNRIARDHDHHERHLLWRRRDRRSAPRRGTVCRHRASRSAMDSHCSLDDRACVCRLGCPWLQFALGSSRPVRFRAELQDDVWRHRARNSLSAPSLG